MDVKSEEIVEAREDLVKAKDQARESAKEKILEIHRNQVARIAELKEDLRKYGTHSINCASRTFWIPDRDVSIERLKRACDCGLDEALKR